jgi:probable F420-dependent oxidoreductase
MKVGVILPIAEDDKTNATLGYAAIRDIALAAEQAGFDSIWVFDHLLFRFGDKPTAGIWEAWSILAALAAVTSRVELGTLVMCTAFRNPALLAKMAVTVDEISGGRLILGLGAGWHQPEFDAFGIPFDHKVDRFEEALEIIVPLVRDGAVDFHGTHYSAANSELRPRGPRAGIPILIGAAKPRMLRLTARVADSWNTAWLGDPSALDERKAKIDAACQAEGRSPGSLELTVGVQLTYPPDLAAGGQPPDPGKHITGAPADVAAAFGAYAERGAGHLICSLSSDTREALDWLAEGLRLYRAQAAAA